MTICSNKKKSQNKILKNIKIIMNHISLRFKAHSSLSLIMLIFCLFKKNLFKVFFAKILEQSNITDLF